MNNIAIIGGGNLGTAIAQGLIKSKFVKAENITVTKRNIQSLKKLQEDGVAVTNNNIEAIKNCDTIIFAIKPFQIKEVLEELKPHFKNTQHIISVVTGINILDMQDVLGKDIAITRAMPNTAIAIQESITCLTSINVSANQKEYVEALFNTLGKTAVIEEKLMNAATVLGACGTAYAMRYIRANIQGGIEIGFSAATASLIAAQTVKGAAELLLTTHTHPEQEIDKVTTPKGCTITGLNEMEHQGFSSSIIKGIAASFDKIG
jgi:pyrroline-5-carboxylate reductase